MGDCMEFEISSGDIGVSNDSNIEKNGLKLYDVLIIGSGTAGLNAALYSVRAGLKTIILDRAPSPGGQIALSSIVENWLGEKSISGSDLANKFASHVKSFGVEIKTFVSVESVSLSGEIKTTKTSSEIFKSKTVIIATGSKERKLGIPGEEKFKGKGVSYCALCDAAFFKNKEVAVIGGGNTAIEEAQYISKFASKIYIIHRRDKFRADKIIVDKAEHNEKIEFMMNKSPIEFFGNDKLEGVKLKDNVSGNISDLNVSGVFVFVGMIPNSELFSDLKKDNRGYLVSNEYMETNIPGVFVAGDIRNRPLNQLITAASDGAIAAISAYNYLSK